MKPDANPRWLQRWASVPHGASSFGQTVVESVIQTLPFGAYFTPSVKRIRARNQDLAKGGGHRAQGWKDLYCKGKVQGCSHFRNHGTAITNQRIDRHGELSPMCSSLRNPGRGRLMGMVLFQHRAAVCAALALCCGSAAMAQSSYTWRGLSGDWSDPTNWNPTGVPNNGATAIIGGTQPLLIEYYETTALRNFQASNPNVELYIYGGALSRQSWPGGSNLWGFSGRMTIGFDANFSFLQGSGGPTQLQFDLPTSRLVLEPGAIANFASQCDIDSLGVIELQSLGGDIGARLIARDVSSSSEVRISAGALISTTGFFAQRVTGSGSLNIGYVLQDNLGIARTTFAPDAPPQAVGTFRVQSSSSCRAEYECDLRGGGVADRLVFITNQSQVQILVRPRMQGVTPTLGMAWTILDVANPTANNRNITIAQDVTLPHPRWSIRPRFNTATVDAVIACTADYNVDGVVDFFDYLDFVSDFAAGRGGSDFNADYVVDLFDYLDFVAAFADGCAP